MSSSNISVDDRFNDFYKVVKAAGKSTKPPIGKALFMLRDSNDNIKYFKPRVVAIGPIHHSDEKYKKAEGFKQILAEKFIRQSDCPDKELFKAIKDKIDTFKNCYEEEVREKCENDDEPAWILLIDGCAVLQFIQSAEDQTLKKMVKNDLAPFAAQDIFLLENQLPFEVLYVLMKKHKDGPHKFLKSIQDFIAANMVPATNQKLEPTSETVHLLDLLRTTMLSNNQTPITMPQNATKKGAPSMNWQTFRNVMELKAAGIKAKPSSTSSLKSFGFEEGKLSGTMKLPPIRVDDSTASKFFNMIAYEMHPKFENEGEVSSYVCLMDSLIDHADDVKELRKANILHNMLGSDEEVANLFNAISTDLVPNPEAYDEFKRNIQAHYDTKWKTTIAQEFHDHFGTPWSVLAFAGALIGLILSLLQTLSGFLG